MAGAEIKSDWMKRRIMSRIRGYNLNIGEIVELQNLFSNLLFLRFFSNFQKLTYRPLLTFDGLILIIPNIRNRLVECAGELPIRLKFLKFKQKIFFLYLTFRMDYDILNT